MALLSSDKHSQVTVKQIGGTTGVFRRNRYDSTAQRHAAGQKTSWHQAKLNHMESRFFSFHSFIFFNLESLHLFSVPNTLFQFTCHLTSQKAVFNLPCFLPATRATFFLSINFLWKEMSSKANKICAPEQKALVRDGLCGPKTAAHRFCLADCGLGNLNESFAWI